MVSLSVSCSVAFTQTSNFKKKNQEFKEFSLGNAYRPIFQCGSPYPIYKELCLVAKVSQKCVFWFHCSSQCIESNNRMIKWNHNAVSCGTKARFPYGVGHTSNFFISFFFLELVRMVMNGWIFSPSQKGAALYINVPVLWWFLFFPCMEVWAC